MNKIIVSDTSPLIALARIGHISLLSELMGQIIIPERVAIECTQNKTRPGAISIQTAINENRIEVQNVENKEDFLYLYDVLDEGEVEAIILATTLQAPILIDEKTGRLIARKHKLKVIGSGGLLIAAKQKGLLSAIKPLITDLQNNGYRLSNALIREILIRVDED